MDVMAVKTPKRRKAKDERKASDLRIRVTAEEKTIFAKAAKLASRTLSDWLRVVAKEAAAKSRGGE
jgi:uncharacterized protein (DUF1778 family)